MAGQVHVKQELDLEFLPVCVIGDGLYMFQWYDIPIIYGETSPRWAEHILFDSSYMI